MALKKIVILFSGRGSNMENIIKKLHGKSVDVAAVITNNEKADGIQKAVALGVKVDIVPHTAFYSREEFDAALVEKISSYSADLVVLAGFMRILTPIFTQNIRAINIHPSILPLFKGKDAIKKSFESDMGEGGVSVHFVSDEMDGGEIIMQERIAIFDSDTLEEFEERVHSVEYELYPQAILEALNRVAM